MPDSIRRLAPGCLLAGFAGPEVPGRLARALAACAKHFPGHGATSPSHHEVATVTRSRGDIEADLAGNAQDDGDQDEPPDVSARWLEIHGPLPSLELDGRTLVVVLCDPHRHPWQHDVLDAPMRRPDRVIVGAGRPAPGLPEPYVRTRGIAPGPPAPGPPAAVADALTGARA